MRSSTSSPAQGTVGAERRPVHDGQTRGLRSRRHGSASLAAADRQDSRTESLEVFILGGKPIREPVAMYGPFVMNTRAELIEAFEDYQAGRLGSIPATHASLA